jgi:hypothetical protein
MAPGAPAHKSGNLRSRRMPKTTQDEQPLVSGRTGRGQFVNKLLVRVSRQQVFLTVSQNFVLPFFSDQLRGKPETRRLVLSPGGWPSGWVQSPKRKVIFDLAQSAANQVPDIRLTIGEKQASCAKPSTLKSANRIASGQGRAVIRAAPQARCRS